MKKVLDELSDAALASCHRQQATRYGVQATTPFQKLQ